MKRREFVGRLAIAGGAAAAAAGCRNGREQRDGPAARPRLQSEAGAYGSRDPRVEINLSHIDWNLSCIRSRIKVPVLAVVKANAYGHGLVDVARHLESRNVHGLMVGKLAEANRLRAAGIRCPIFNFGPFGREDAENVLGDEIVQSVYTDDVQSLDEAAVKFNRPVGVNIHVDTGMNRAGVPVDRALAYLEKVAGLPRIKIEGISTTFTEDPVFDTEQLRRFLEVCAEARTRRIDYGLRHGSSSAGLFHDPAFHLDMVRPGITLYGYYPNSATREENALGLKPALRLVGRITFVRNLKAGESLSYLRAVSAVEPMRIATVGIGYSDGYLPSLGGKGVTRIHGKSFSVLPAVTSNHIMVDLKNDDSVKVGDDVVLVDDKRDSGVAADDLAELGGVSDYKILIGLNPALPREYTGGEPFPAPLG